MNLLKFREEAQQYQPEQFTLFRQQVYNYIVALNDAQELDEAEVSRDRGERFKEWSEEDEEAFSDEWSYIGEDAALQVFNEMGWDFEKLSQDTGGRYSHLSDVLYKDYTFYSVWKEISSCNDVDFCYAMIVLSHHINEQSKLRQYVKLPVLASLRRNGLGSLAAYAECPKAFIAMWFDDTMEFARQNIASAVTDCGYTPVFIDEVEHSRQIVPEILKELKDCLFVVADLTGHNNGVYYEAGYAHALGKEVLLSCRKSDFENCHFDIAQVNTVVWENETELQRKLSRRIEAVIGRNE